MTTWIGKIPNRFVYVRAEFADGIVRDGPFSVFVQYHAGFKWNEDETLHGSGCIVGAGTFHPCSAQPVSRGFAEVDVGSHTDFILDVF